VESAGHLLAAAGDIYRITGNFINQSTQNILWNTAAAELEFRTGDSSTHNLYIPGVDKGLRWGGLKDNFAWGTLDLTGQILNLVDGNTGNSGTALYVGLIEGLTWNESHTTVMDIIGNGFNIYYNPLLNPDLDKKVYSLTDGGRLAPVPVPGAMVLLVAGLARLAVYYRRRNQTQVY
jgi:hypothetical protein